MSILNVNKINPVGGGSTVTIAGIASVTSSVTAPSFVGNLTGTATAATGLNGTPNISVGTINASSATITGGMISAQNSGAGSGSSQIQLQPYGTDGYINCTASNNLYTRMGAGFTIRTRIDGSGNFTVNSGNLIIGTAGKGIDYSAQTASAIAGVSVTSEICDHYEEGTFTPFLSAASSAPSVSYGAERGGRYTRIGNMVFYSIGLNIASYSGGSGDAYIGGFPYLGAGTPGWDGVHVFRDTAAIGLNSRTNTVGGWISDTALAGYPVLYIQSMSSTSNYAAAFVQAGSMTTGRLTVHGQYHIG